MSIISGAGTTGAGVPPRSITGDVTPTDRAPIRIQAVPGQGGNLLELVDALGNLVGSWDIAGVIAATLSPADLAGAVILAPNTPTRNTVQPTADADPGLIIKQGSATQSASLLETQSPSGAALTKIMSQGTLWVQPTATPNFTILFNVFDVLAGGPQFQVLPAGGGGSVFAYVNNTNDVGLTVLGWNGPGQIADIFQTAINIAPNFGISGTGEVYVGEQTSTTARRQGSYVGSYTNATDATRTTRIAWSTYDFGGKRENFRIEADGTAARIGFLGANAIARPTATTDLLQDFINFGLKTGGGPTPLNLLGGAFTASGANSLGATTYTGDVTLSTHNIITDTVTGTKIGTATTQKLGLWGVAPVVQQANASAAGIAGIAAGALYAQADMVAVKAALTAIQASLATNGVLANTA